MKRRIAILGGYWSTNIGNAFFQLGAEYVLRQAFPDDFVFFIGDQPGYAFPQKGSPEKAFDLVAHLDIDYLVVLGPFIRPEFERVLLPTLEAVTKRGARLLMMGVGMMQYDPATIEGVKSLLRQLPIDAFITRDRPTYEAFQDVCPNSFDGVDVAFFVSDVWGSHGPKPSIDPYVVLNFDQIPEPDFIEVSGDRNALPVIEVGNRRFEMRMSDWRRGLSEKGTLFNILDRSYLPAKTTDRLGDFRVIRTDHRYNPVFPRKIYNAPNTYAGDIPHSYLSIYSGAAMTLSNRVHACAATLAFGNPAMLVSKTPRAFLLDRAGAKTIKERPTRLDMDALAEEKSALLSFLRSAVQP